VPLNTESIRRLLDQVRKGKLSPDDAVEKLRHLPFEDLGFAKVDHHRGLRVGMPEVVFSPGKTPAQVAEIFKRLANHAQNVLATRASPEQFRAVKKIVRGARFEQIPRAITAELMGNHVERIYDVGVAGIHRLLAHRKTIANSRVVIVCAGMEGALPSVVGGMVGVPVIAVPTSVGYGAAFQGMAALLGMMNSCASNVSVVNIDNGFGAGYVASLINRL